MDSGKNGDRPWVNEIFVGGGCEYQTRKLFLVRASEKPTFDLFLRRLHPDDSGNCAYGRREGQFVIKLFIELIIEPLTPKHTRSGGSGQSGQATYSDDGTPVQFDGISYDITERKRVEQKILESETRLRDSNSRLEIYFDQSDGRGVNKERAGH